ncbi:hypothetical protein [Streptomyces sp. NPDC090080]|uniref:hypothetical protein n=1 Tax=Streptomyces sp. NPDC090080 TaxID=3365939 RepID=UPI003804BF61
MTTQTSHMHRDLESDQGLALTLAALILTGTGLLASCWVGPLATFTVTAVLIVAAYAVPGLTRRLAIRRAGRELLRSLPAD